MRGSAVRASDTTAWPSGACCDGLVPHVRPHRPVHVVARPDRAVGEADLAADRPPAARDAPPFDLAQHVVGRGDVEIRHARADGRERRAALEGVEQRVGDRRDVHRVQRTMPSLRKHAPSGASHTAVATTMPTTAASERGRRRRSSRARRRATSRPRRRRGRSRRCRSRSRGSERRCVRHRSALSPGTCAPTRRGRSRRGCPLPIPPRAGGSPSGLATISGSPSARRSRAPALPARASSRSCRAG